MNHDSSELLKPNNNNLANMKYEICKKYNDKNDIYDMFQYKKIIMEFLRLLVPVILVITTNSLITNNHSQPTTRCCYYLI